MSFLQKIYIFTKPLFVLFVVPVFWLLNACTAPTQIQSSWQDPMFNAPPFNSIAVLAMMEDTASSRAFEQQAAQVLRQNNVNVVEGRASINASANLSYQEMEEKLKSNGTDGILIFKLIAVDSEYAFRPPTRYRLDAPYNRLHPTYSYYYPSAYYFPYWQSGIQVTSNPGYWSEREYYVIESALYDNKTDRLVWIATSRTYAPDETEELSQSILDIVSERLSSANLITALR